MERLDFVFVDHEASDTEANFALEWTGRVLHVRHRGPAVPTASGGGRGRLVETALRIAHQRWGLARSQIDAVLIEDGPVEGHDSAP